VLACVLQLKLDEKRAVEEVEARLGGGDSGGNMPARSVSNIQLEVLSAHALEDEQVEARQCTTQTLLELCSSEWLGVAGEDGRDCNTSCQCADLLFCRTMLSQAATESSQRWCASLYA
jgi:hypothetical protein